MRKKTWDLYAPIYKRAMQADHKIYEFMYDRIPELVRDKEVLEIATGPGLLAKHVAPAAKRMIATDYSEGMIAQAKKGDCPENLSFEIADAMRLPYQSDSFDAVLIANALHIVPDPERVLREIDRALSAKTDNRPEFQRMIKESAGRAFEMVLVWKLDRFARNRYDSAHYKSVLRRNGVKVVSATESISEGAEGILLESMLEGMAEYYSAELSEKVIRGLTENALKCKYNGGTLPVGYVIDENQFFQIDPLTAPAVLAAFQQYASGVNMRQIADEMNLKGVRTKAGGKMSINSVTSMLHNRKYIGEFRYRDIVQPDGIPAIVPKDLFDRVQERMAANKKAPAKHKAEDEYLLTTKLFCGKCRCYMAGESGTGRNGTHRYYKCVSVKHHRGCDKKSVRKEWIENLAIELTRKVIFDDELIELLAKRALDVLNAESSVLPLLHKQYADTQKAIDNLIHAIEQGILTPSTKDRLEALEQEKSRLSVQIMREEMARPTLTQDQVLFWFHRLRKLDMKKLDHRRRLIDTFINAIYLYEDHLEFVFNYKEGTKTVTFAELEAADLGSDFTGLGAPRENPQMPFNDMAVAGFIL